MRARVPAKSSCASCACAVTFVASASLCGWVDVRVKQFNMWFNQKLYVCVRGKTLCLTFCVSASRRRRIHAGRPQHARARAPHTFARCTCVLAGVLAASARSYWKMLACVTHVDSGARRRMRTCIHTRAHTHNHRHRHRQQQQQLLCEFCTLHSRDGDVDV